MECVAFHVVVLANSFIENTNKENTKKATGAVKVVGKKLNNKSYQLDERQKEMYGCGPHNHDKLIHKMKQSVDVTDQNSANKTDYDTGRVSRDKK